MREIKFRAFDKVLGIMVFPEFTSSGGNLALRDCDCEGTLMQSTPLKDEDENSVYEGDIVAMHQFLFDGNEVESQIVGVVGSNDYGWTLTQIKNEYFQEYTGYDLHEGACNLGDIYGLHDQSWTILGNIHENPDLLKAKP